MRFKCGLSYNAGHADSPVPRTVGWATEDTGGIVEMCTRAAAGLQVNGGVIVLTILDRETGSAMSLQRRSCHGFGKMVELAVQALDEEHIANVPDHIGRETLAELLVRG